MIIRISKLTNTTPFWPPAAFGPKSPTGLCEWILTAALESSAFDWLSGRCRFSQKFVSFYSQLTSKSIDNIDSCSIDTSLKRTDICAVNLGTMSKLLLRQPPSLPLLSQIACKYLPNVHSEDSSVLQSISLRSILDKTTS
jgi:hypothetical protein